MSKAVMMSIQPKWVEKILNGEKTIEVRKTAPKWQVDCTKLAHGLGELGKMYLEPIKVYIYCTKGGEKLFYDHYCEVYEGTNDKHIARAMADTFKCKLLNGKVVAEFTCDRLDSDSPVLIEPFSDDYACETYYSLLDLKRKETCLTEEEVWGYGKGERLYLWHISDLKIYDKPKMLGEFYSGKQCKDWDKNMDDCVGHGLDYQEKCKHCSGGYIPLTRPPQSWGYVEEI